MVMPDAVDALVRLAKAECSLLRQSVYNITAFNPSAEEVRSLVIDGFPDAEITFDPDIKRQAIVDSWPADVDDAAAREDWGLAPRYDLVSGFADYLIPRIRDLYRSCPTTRRYRPHRPGQRLPADGRRGDISGRHGGGRGRVAYRCRRVMQPEMPRRTARAGADHRWPAGDGSYPQSKSPGVQLVLRPATSLLLLG